MAWASHGWLQGALLGSAAALLASRAPAEAGAREPSAPSRNGPRESGPEPSGWLRWQGPIECQNTLEVERQLESLLGYSPETGQLPATRVEVGWGSARGWALLIRVAQPQGERRREVIVRTCADGFDVVALTLALILDPELGGDAELEGESLADESPADGAALQPTVAEPEPPPSDGLALAAAAAAPSPGPVEDTAGPAEHTAEPAEDTGAETVELPPPRADGRPALRLAAGGRADVGSLPGSMTRSK